MYSLRGFDSSDLHAIAHDLPSLADVAHEVADHPGGLHGVVVDDPRGRIYACLVASRHELVTNLRTIGLGIVRLAFVTEAARIGGIHSLLFELDGAFAERFEGPDRVFQAVVAQWDEQDIWYFRRMRDYEPIAQCLTFAGAVAPADPPAEVTIEATSADAVAALEFGAGPATGVRRSRESFLHRARLPLRSAWIARRNGIVIAWAIARRGATGSVLEDQMIDWHDGPLAAALLAAVADGQPSLRTTRWTNQEAEIAALQTAGLRLHGPEHLIAARVSAFGIAPASLTESTSFGELDTGSRPLPRLSHNERIVTPPPPGTQSTEGDHRRHRTSQRHQPR